PAIVTLSDVTGTFDFGPQTVGSVTDHKLTLTNSGGRAATAIAATGKAMPFDFKGGTPPGTGGTCGVTLDAGATCDLVFTFSPTAAGAASATATVTYNDGGTTQTLSLTLTGSGTTAASLALSDTPTFDFGSVVVGAATDKTFTVSNSGGSSA